MKFQFSIFIVTLSAHLFVAAVENKINHEDFRQVIRKNIKKIMNCYDAGLKINNKLEGKIVVLWTVSKDGSVASANIKSTTMNNDLVQNCIIDNIKQLKFPTPPDGTTAEIIFPFVFASRK